MDHGRVPQKNMIWSQPSRFICPTFQVISGGQTRGQIRHRTWKDQTKIDVYLVCQKKNMRVPRVKKSRPSRRRKSFVFKIGDQVRITHLRRTFQRNYDQIYTEEIFLMRGDPIKGTFYASKLQKVSKDDQTIWRIEKILRKCKVREKELLVQWLEWPKKFDS